ncbi:hypothetical protein N7519_000485 [Penicillium mononematosum]|uniref:uncharacterized protein n=1 Tax=Penicillium mononematosum TaxID=268346 RepID=UPI002547D530|nr:uncharacterized protein N7519_000485 [Penicillium mononematosum]KAJ6190464.1 hypothetical protein N7519_000485 [Penicillium mononematosum]
MHDSDHSFDGVRRLREVRARRERRKTLRGGMEKKSYWTEHNVRYWYGAVVSFQRSVTRVVQDAVGGSEVRRHEGRLPAKATSPKDDKDSEGDDDESEASERSLRM